MSKLNVKNGTPVGNSHLCGSCDWGQFMTGYRESDMLAICTNTSPNLVLPFIVRECSEYRDKHKPNWEQMEKLAIEIQPVRISGKTAGFSAPQVLCPAAGGDKDEVEDEAALAR
jgi:hypothetical protein